MPNSQHVITIQPTGQALQPVLARDSFYQVWQMEPHSSGTLLFYGHPHILAVSQRLACKYLLQSENLIVLDGANVFDPYLIAELARKAGRAPEDFLRRIRISRSFTCHQMLSLIRKAQSAVRQWRSQLILLLGPLTTFYDESVPNYEAQAIFRSFQQELNRLEEMGFRLLLACQQPNAPTQRAFIRQLKASALGVVSCWEVELVAGQPKKRFVSGSGRRLPSSRGQNNTLLIKIEKPAQSNRRWLIQGRDRLNPRSYLSL
jgi:hypothetical protein